MAAWTAPITWTAGAVLTAAQMVTEVRDHLIWLKAAVDLITNSTATDGGTGTYLNIVRTNGAETTFRATVAGDTDSRLLIDSTGIIGWGDGTDPVDTNLYRADVNILGSDSKFDPYSLNLQIKAGAPNDGDIGAAAESGDIVLDTANSRLYVRVGSTWKYATLT